MPKLLTEKQLNRLSGIPIGKMSEGLRKILIETIFEGGTWDYATFAEKKLLKRKGFCFYE